MGQSYSLLSLAWQEIKRHNFFDHVHNFTLISPNVKGVIFRSTSFKKASENSETMIVSDDESSMLKDCKAENVVLERSLSFKEMLGKEEVCKGKNELKHKPMPALAVVSSKPEFMFSPRPVNELDAAAVTLQKVYKSYRTRRNLADCAVVAEELW